MFFKTIIKSAGIILLGLAGAFLFQVFVFPWMLSNPYFEKFEFIKAFKEGKIVVNPTQNVYITENTALQSSIEKAAKSVVAIQSKTSSGTVFGSGFVMASDGTILTLSTLTPSSAKITVYVGDENFTGQVIKRDAENNLAILRIEKTGLTTTGFAALDQIKLGERVFLVGINSKTKEQTANEGIIRTISENVFKTTIIDSSYLQGGPLFDTQGSLVGINTVDSAGKVSAIPIAKIKSFTGL